MNARQQKVGLWPVLLLGAVIAAACPAAPISAQDQEPLQAFVLYEKKKWSRAFKELLPLAQVGHQRAMLLVGEMYLYGEGINENQAEGLAWLEKAAQAGQQRDAYFVAGEYFAKEKADYGAAAKYMIGAAELGHPEAQAMLADMYAIGHGVPRDKAQAEKWYKLAAEHSDSLWVTYQAAQAYLRGADRDYAEGVDLLRDAAEQGHGLAQDELGFMYLDGSLVPRDLGEAERWLTLAVRQGVPTAYLHLGTLYWQDLQPKNAVHCYMDALRAGIETDNAEVRKQAMEAVSGTGLIGLFAGDVIAEFDNSPVGACNPDLSAAAIALIKSYWQDAR